MSYPPVWSVIIKHADCVEISEHHGTMICGGSSSENWWHWRVSSLVEQRISAVVISDSCRFFIPPIDGIGLDAQIITGDLQWEIDDTAFNDMEIIHASSWYQNQMICVYDIYYHNTYIYREWIIYLIYYYIIYSIWIYFIIRYIYILRLVRGTPRKSPNGQALLGGLNRIFTNKMSKFQ